MFYRNMAFGCQGKVGRLVLKPPHIFFRHDEDLALEQLFNKGRKFFFPLSLKRFIPFKPSWDQDESKELDKVVPGADLPPHHPQSVLEPDPIARYGLSAEPRFLKCSKMTRYNPLQYPKPADHGSRLHEGSSPNVAVRLELRVFPNLSPYDLLDIDPARRPPHRESVSPSDWSEQNRSDIR